MGIIDEKMHYILLSSAGFPTHGECSLDGSTIHFVDTGELYVMFDGTWENDLRLITALETVL
jgi:hypothetical protein